MGNRMESPEVLETLSVKGQCTFTGLCISIVLGKVLLRLECFPVAACCRLNDRLKSILSGEHNSKEHKL